MKPIRLQSSCCALLALAALSVPLAVHAQLKSKSGEIIVMQPKDLPEAAEIAGNSFFLHTTSSGNFYLYEEQLNGAQIATFDVTDPAHIKLKSTTKLSVTGPFDFVRPLGTKAELVRFRDGKQVAVLDMTQANHPSLQIVSALNDPGRTQPIGETAFLSTSEPYDYVRSVARDYQVVDISTPGQPELLTTIKQVRHQVTNNETGTTFLLGSDGMTVIRRTDVERDYEASSQQAQGN